MADSKLTALTAATSASTDDLLYVVDDPGGTPASKKITFDNLQGSLTKVGKMTVTQPGTSSILAVADGKTATISNTLTFTGTDGSSVAFGTGGTVAYTNATTLSSLASIGTITTGVWNGTDIALADGGTGASLADPNADRIMFWDDSAGAVTWLTAGSGLTLTDTTLTASGQTLFESVVATSGGDYTTLGAALAAGKKRIFVRNGTYAETGENTISGDVVIIGESRDEVIIDVDGTTNDRILVGAGAAVTSLQIENLTLKCTTVTDSILDSANTAGSPVSNVLIRNVIFDGGGTQLGASSGSSESSGYCIFDNVRGLRLQSSLGLCYVRGTSGAFDLVQVTRCSNDANSGSRLMSMANNNTITKLIVADNQWNAGSGNTVLIWTGTGSTATANVLIHGNTFSGGVMVDFSASSWSGLWFCGANYFKQDGSTIGLSYPGVNGQVVGNVFDGFTTGIQGNASNDGIVYANNVFRSCTTGITLPANHDNNFIFGNSFVSCTTNISNSGTNNNITENYGVDLAEDLKLIEVKNTSGGTINQGEVVVMKAAAAGNEVTTTTTQGDDNVIGVVHNSAGIANNATGFIVVRGKIVTLKVNGTTDIAIGDLLGTYTTAGIAMKASAGDMVFAKALEAYTADDSSGVIDALLISPRLI